jgi:hypothetical protein
VSTQRGKAFILLSKQVFPSKLSCRPHPVCCRGAKPAGLQNYRKGDQPLVEPSSVRVTSTILTEATFESKDGSTNVSKATRSFYAQVSFLQRHVWTRGNLSVWLAGDRHVVSLPFLLSGIRSTTRALQLVQRKARYHMISSPCPRYVVKYDLIYMIMTCSCCAMHACKFWGPQRFVYSSIAQGLRLALYKGLHATSARLIQKGGYRAGPDSRTLRVELTEMLNVP